MRPDGRTPFQYLLGTPCVSLLCMFGESVFALIPDHEVRASQTDEQMDQWLLVGTRCFVRRTLVGTKHDLPKRRSVRRKPHGEQWSRRETIEARGTRWNFDVEMDSGISGPPVTHVQMKGCRQRRHRWKFPQCLTCTSARRTRT